MSHTDKLAAARALIEDFNSSVSDSNKVNVDQFFKKLEALGGYNEAVLAEAGWEDIQKCGVPILLAKAIVKLFRSASVVVQERGPSEKKAARMLPKELIEAYSPDDVDTPVALELDKRSDGKRFLFIEDDGTVNVDASLNEFTSLRRGYAERTEAKHGGKVYRLRRPRDRKAETADENPIYTGLALRPDGTCDQTNYSWEGVPTEVRQLVRIAVQIGEAKVNTLDDAKDLIDRTTATDAETKLRNRYIKAAARFDELKQQGDLPKLKVVIGAKTPGKNDPFYQKHVTF